MAAAPLLGFSVAKLAFDHNSKPNPWAFHDVGQAMAHLTVEAGGWGLFVHQMGGFDPVATTEALGLPATQAVVAAFVIGEGVEEAAVPEALRERELKARVRRPRGEFVLSGKFGQDLRGSRVFCLRPVPPPLFQVRPELAIRPLLISSSLSHSLVRPHKLNGPLNA